MSGFILHLDKECYEANRLQYTVRDYRALGVAFQVGFFCDG